MTGLTNALADKQETAVPRKPRSRWLSPFALGIFLAIIFGVPVFASIGVMALNQQDQAEGLTQNAVMPLPFEQSTELAVGDAVTFGVWDDQPLEWGVLAIDQGTALLITTETVARLPYNEAPADSSWQQSSLRSWLNEDFYSAAFSTNQRQLITETDYQVLDAHQGVLATINPDNDDRVFLLSTEEAHALLKQNQTLAPIIQGDRQPFWFRAYDSAEGCIVGFYVDGSIGWNGDYTDDISASVRPALWVALP
jgi:hypothetical protein